MFTKQTWFCNKINVYSTPVDRFTFHCACVFLYNNLKYIVAINHDNYNNNDNNNNNNDIDNDNRDD